MGEQTTFSAAVSVTEYQSLLLLLTEIRTDLKHALTSRDDHEARLRTLERKVWTAAGFAASIGAGGGVVLSRILGG